MSGTSMAAPFVAGLAALLAREAPNLSGYQIKEVITQTSTKVSGLAAKVVEGSRAKVNDSVVSAQSKVSVSTYQPAYVAKMDSRYVASDNSNVSASGCGLVTAIGGVGPFEGLMILSLLFMPLLIGLGLKYQAQRMTQSTRRKFERFEMNSSVTVKVGEQEFIGNMKTISVGGVSFEAQQMLEKGGVVNLTITSPDGSQTIDVQGAVVWSAKNESYGVEFKEANSGILAWTKNLVRASS
jgi:hypothetical protein